MSESLSHYGVPGMKWGVRKDREGFGKKATNRKIAKLDKKFEKNKSSTRLWMETHNRAAQLSNDNDIPRINAKYAGNDFRQDSPTRRKYYQEHADAFLNNLNTAAKELGTNASGTREYRISLDVSRSTDFQPVWSLTTAEARKIKHVDSDETTYVIGKVDERGMIVSMSIEDETLSHYGVPGMKWGVRKDRNRVNSSSKLTKKERAARNKRADIQSRRRQVSDKDIDSLISRLEKEQKLNKLIKQDLNPGRAFVDDVLQTSGKNAANRVIGAVAAGSAMYVVRGLLTKEWGLKEWAGNIPKFKK